MTTLSLDLSAELIFESSYVDKILGKLNSEIADESNPYSVHVLFRCRICDSKHKSFGSLRNHLKGCEIEGFWRDFADSESKVVAVLESKDLDEPHEAPIKMDPDPESLPDDNFLVFDSNNNQEIVAKPEDRMESSFSEKNKLAVKNGASKKRIKLPNSKSSHSKKTKTGSLVLKPASQVKEKPMKFDQFTKEEVADEFRLDEGSEVAFERTPEARPKRNSKAVVSYEEQIIDIVLEASPSASPKVSKNNKPLISSSTVEERTDHAKIHHPVLRFDSLPRNATELNCKHCSESLPRRKMIVHMRSKHSDLRFICNACFKAFSAAEELKVHKSKCKQNSFLMMKHRSRSRSVHSQKRQDDSPSPLTCVYCSASFSSSAIGRSILVQHLKHQHAAKFVCRFCFYNTQNKVLGNLHKCDGPQAKTPPLQITEGGGEESQCVKTRKSRDSFENRSDPEPEVAAETRHPFKQIQTTETDEVLSEQVVERTVDKAEMNCATLRTLDDCRKYLNASDQRLYCPFCERSLSVKYWSNFREHVNKSHLKSSTTGKANSVSKSEVVNEGSPVELESPVEKCAVEAKQEPTNSPTGESSKLGNEDATNDSKSDTTKSSTTSKTRRSARLSSTAPDMIQPLSTFESQVQSEPTALDSQSDLQQNCKSWMKIEANGDIVRSPDKISPVKSDSQKCYFEFPTSVLKESNVVNVEKTPPNLKRTFSPLTIDIKFKPLKESSRSGPPLNKEVKSLLGHDANTPELSIPKCVISEVHAFQTADSPVRKFTLRNKDKRHSSVMSAKEDPYLQGVDTKKSERTPCPMEDCRFVGTTASLMAHLVQKHDQQNVCHLCFKCLQSESQMSRHLQDVHNEFMRKKGSFKVSVGPSKKFARKRRGSLRK